MVRTRVRVGSAPRLAPPPPGSAPRTYRQHGSDKKTTEKEFLELGLRLARKTPSRGTALSVKLDRFSAHYGVVPLIACILWDLLFDWTRPLRNCMPHHLLWALHFLVTYDSECVIASRFEVDEKTYRKWLWFMLEGITSLTPQLVSLNVNGYNQLTTSL